MKQVEYSNSSLKHVKSSSILKFEEELIIKRLKIAKSDLQQGFKKEVRGNVPSSIIDIQFHHPYNVQYV